MPLLACMAMAASVAVATFSVSKISAAEKTGRLFYLGLAYDGAPPEGKDVNDFNFATENLSALFSSLSVSAFHEVNISELKGEAATYDAFKNGLAALKDAVQGDDIVVLYFGSHGGTSKGGWGAGLAGGSITGSDLREALAAIPCPVIAVVSTCGSGGFARPGKKETPLPPNVAALCACKRKKTTGSQLDIALCEALAGFADRDHNGDVTLREIIEYIPQRYQEQIPQELRKKEAEELMPVIEFSKDAPLNRVLTAASPDLVAVWHQGEWHGGLRLGEEDGKPRVQFLGWDRNDPTSGYGMPDSLIEPEMVFVPGAFSPVLVEQGGTWYPARIIAKEGRAFRVHYLGYNEEETVQPIRVRFLLSSRRADRQPKNRGAGKKREVKLTGLEQKFVNLINAARQERGLKPLKINAALVAEGREHAGAMAQRGELADSFDGEFPGDRIRGTGVQPIHWGITSGKSKSPADLVKEWVESPIASHNILEPNVNELGIGTAADPDGGDYAAATYVEVVE